MRLTAVLGGTGRFIAFSLHAISRPTMLWLSYAIRRRCEKPTGILLLPNQKAYS